MRLDVQVLTVVLVGAVGCATPESSGAAAAAAQPEPPLGTEGRAARAALAELERGIDDPQVVVDYDYVKRLVAARDAAAPAGPGRGWNDGWPILTDEERRDIARRLRDALPAKRGSALVATTKQAIAFGELVPDPVVRTAALRAWTDGDAEFRRYVLDYGWAVVRTEEFVPLLRVACDDIEQRDPPRTQWHVADVPTVALLRLLELRPDEGRARILADIRRPDPRFGGRALAALPDRHLEEVDAHFRRPDEEFLHWSFDLEKFGPLAERYGGPDSVAAAKRLLDGTDTDRAVFSAPAQLIRVVLAHDREDGLRRLDRALRAEHQPQGIRPAVLLENVLAGNWIERLDLWGPDAARFVESIVSDEDPRIDDETRATAKRLLADRRQA